MPNIILLDQLNDRVAYCVLTDPAMAETIVHMGREIKQSYASFPDYRRLRVTDSVAWDHVKVDCGNFILSVWRDPTRPELNVMREPAPLEILSPAEAPSVVVNLLENGDAGIDVATEVEAKLASSDGEAATGDEAVVEAHHSVAETPELTREIAVALIEAVEPKAVTLRDFEITADALRRYFLGASRTCVGCFVAGTLILTTRGSVPVEKIRLGELVLTYRRDRFQQVTDVSRRTVTGLVDLHVDGIPRLSCTPEHLVSVNYVGGAAPTTWRKAAETEGRRGWEPADMRRSGVFSVHPRVTSGTEVYTFKVAGDDCFAANGLLVHDGCGE